MIIVCVSNVNDVIDKMSSVNRLIRNNNIIFIGFSNRMKKRKTQMKWYENSIDSLYLKMDINGEKVEVGYTERKTNRERCVNVYTF